MQAMNDIANAIPILNALRFIFRIAFLLFCPTQGINVSDLVHSK